MKRGKANYGIKKVDGGGGESGSAAAGVETRGGGSSGRIKNPPPGRVHNGKRVTTDNGVSTRQKKAPAVHLPSTTGFIANFVLSPCDKGVANMPFYRDWGYRPLEECDRGWGYNQS
jgi:hypothetical protein